MPIIYEPSIPTACERGDCKGKPRADLYRDGTIWECDYCGRHWIVWSGAQYNEPFSAWRWATVEELTAVPAEPNEPCEVCGRRHPGPGTPGVCDR